MLQQRRATTGELAPASTNTLLISTGVYEQPYVLASKSIHALLISTEEKRKIEKNNYAGSKTLPASIKEKETRRPEVP